MVWPGLAQMKTIFFILVSYFLLSGCAVFAENTPTGMSEIFSDPEKFDGRKITLSGVIVFSSSGPLLYASCEDSLSGSFRNYVEINTHSAIGMKGARAYEKTMLDLHGKTVTISDRKSVV